MTGLPSKDRGDLQRALLTRTIIAKLKKGDLLPPPTVLSATLGISPNRAAIHLNRALKECGFTVLSLGRNGRVVTRCGKVEKRPRAEYHTRTPFAPSVRYAPKLTQRERREIVALAKRGASNQSELARQFGVTPQRVSQLVLEAKQRSR